MTSRSKCLIGALHTRSHEPMPPPGVVRSPARQAEGPPGVIPAWDSRTSSGRRGSHSLHSTYSGNS